MYQPSDFASRPLGTERSSMVPLANSIPPESYQNSRFPSRSYNTSTPLLERPALPDRLSGGFSEYELSQISDTCARDLWYYASQNGISFPQMTYTKDGVIYYTFEFLEAAALFGVRETNLPNSMNRFISWYLRLKRFRENTRYMDLTDEIKALHKTIEKQDIRHKRHRQHTEYIINSLKKTIEKEDLEYKRHRGQCDFKIDSLRKTIEKQEQDSKRFQEYSDLRVNMLTTTIENQQLEYKHQQNETDLKIKSLISTIENQELKYSDLQTSCASIMETSSAMFDYIKESHKVKYDDSLFRDCLEKAGIKKR